MLFYNATRLYDDIHRGIVTNVILFLTMLRTTSSIHIEIIFECPIKVYSPKKGYYTIKFCLQMIISILLYNQITKKIRTDLTKCTDDIHSTPNRSTTTTRIDPRGYVNPQLIDNRPDLSES